MELENGSPMPSELASPLHVNLMGTFGRLGQLERGLEHLLMFELSTPRTCVPEEDKWQLLIS
jgi:hypothetical protein